MRSPAASASATSARRWGGESDETRTRVRRKSIGGEGRTRDGAIANAPGSSEPSSTGAPVVSPVAITISASERCERCAGFIKQYGKSAHTLVVCVSQSPCVVPLSCVRWLGIHTIWTGLDLLPSAPCRSSRRTIVRERFAYPLFVDNGEVRGYLASNVESRRWRQRLPCGRPVHAVRLGHPLLALPALFR